LGHTIGGLEFEMVVS